MKLIAVTFVIVCLSLSGITSASENQNAAIPQSGFSSFEEMKKWSATSTCCGGWSDRLAAGEEEIHWSSRTFTSGRATTEIVFWGRSGDRIVPRLILPMRFGEYKVVTKEKSVVIQRYENGRGFLAVMTVDVALFNDAFVYGKPRSEENEEGRQRTTLGL